MRTTRYALGIAPLLVSGAVLILVLGGCGGGGDVEPIGSVPQRNSQSTIEKASATTTNREIIEEGVVPDKVIHDIGAHIKLADLVVIGTVSAVSEARWNTPDGQEMKEGEEYPYDPFIYRTYFLNAEKILRGESKYGEPIPFRLVGGTVSTPKGAVTFSPEGDPKLETGSRVLVFLRDTDKYYGGVYEPEAYWPVAGAFSVFDATGDTFTRGFGGDAYAKTFDLGLLTSEVTAQ